MNTSLHNTNGNSVTVKNFSEEKSLIPFASVAVSDYEGNYVTLFFKDLGEVINFSLMINQEVKKAERKERKAKAVRAIDEALAVAPAFNA